MKKIALLLILFSFATICFSQHIYFCLGHKPNGEPVGQLTTGYWATKYAGSKMEILLNMGKYYKNGEIAYFFVERLSDDGKYEIVLNSDDIKIDPDKKWIFWTNLDFTTSGHYRVTGFIGAEAITVALDYIFVDTESAEWNPSKKDVLPNTDYKDAIITIGKSIDTIEGFIPESEVNMVTKLTDQKAVRAGFVIRTGKIIRTNALHVQFYIEEEGIYQYADSMHFYAMP